MKVLNRELAILFSINVAIGLTSQLVQPLFPLYLKEIGATDIENALVMQGNLRVLNARWTDDLVDELVAFPTGFHDDQVDAVSGAVEMLAIYGRKPRGRRGVTQ